MPESSTDLYVHPVSDAQPTAQPSIVKSFVDSGNNGLDGVRSCYLRQIGMTRLTSRIQVIPRSVLENAKGFAIFTVFKAGFLFSARAGSGIVIAKLEDGSKSFVSISSPPHLVYAVTLIMGGSTHIQAALPGRHIAQRTIDCSRPVVISRLSEVANPLLFSCSMVRAKRDWICGPRCRWTSWSRDDRLLGCPQLKIGKLSLAVTARR